MGRSRPPARQLLDLICDRYAAAVCTEGTRGISAAAPSPPFSADRPSCLEVCKCLTCIVSDCLVRACTHKSRLFGNGKRRACVGCSGDLFPPPPPAEKATAREDHARKASTGDGAGDAGDIGYIQYENAP